MLPQIKERERCPVNFLQSEERALHDLSIELIHNRSRHGLHGNGFGAAFRFDETVLLPFASKKFPVERGEEPRLNLRCVAQLMSLRGPEKKCLLGEIRRVGFLAAEREREAVKRHVKFLDEVFGVESRG